MQSKHIVASVLGFCLFTTPLFVAAALTLAERF